MRSNIKYGFTLALPMALALQCFAREEYSRNFDKTVPMAKGQGVRVEHQMGNINIRTHGSGEVQIHAVIRASASNDAEAKRFADQVRIEVAPVGSSLVIRTEYPKEERNGFLDSAIFRSPSTTKWSCPKPRRLS